MQAISFPDEVITHGQVLVEPANLDPRSPLHELPMRVCEVGRIKDADDLMPRLIDMATLSADQQQWMSDRECGHWLVPISYQTRFESKQMINSSSKKFLTDDVLKTVEIIKKESDIDNTSDATKTNYKAEIRRTLAKLNARGKKNAADFLAVLAETRSKATYYRRLAATNYFLRSNISTLMAKLDAATEEADIANTCRSIEYFAAIKKLIADNVGQCPVINAKARASKRTMLGSLSKDGDFREKLYKHLEGSHYQIPFLVAAVSGARPQELQNGIQIYVKDGRLVMTIAGSKVKKSQGQDIRVIEC